ncbi:MAG TPA: hypothetical protein DCZ92_02000 [Elusimicrobia bacterium]|nr:MAG: hypothetical protein A2016_04150 [Elusimicrobia bacterium GWF2_62_30]HBA59598.1 hypothetical protein [Elusimicrobiota bacterium]
MKKLFLPLLLLAPAALPPGAAAIELLLESNKGESGTIGYVDIDRVFKEYSGTSGAREEFLAEIKKKEDAINAKKTGLFTIKAEMAKLRQEREFALTLPSLMETKRSMTEPPPPAPVTVSTSTPAQVEASTPAADGQQPPAAPVAPVEPPPAAPAPAVSQLPGMAGIEMPGVGKIPLSHFKFSVSTSVPEIDAALKKKEGELKAKEEELRAFQRQAERELLEYESHKNEILLGRIYVALKELAQKESVSVVVDKRNILYGQNAVDLTGKLLEKLEENAL